jgi:hypothetical protein
MTSLLSRAADFDCGRRADGTLDLACVCQSRPFKTEAKRAVGDVCHDPADIGAARKWAIARCTASKSFCVFPSRVPLFSPRRVCLLFAVLWTKHAREVLLERQTRRVPSCMIFRHTIVTLSASSSTINIANHHPAVLLESSLARLPSAAPGAANISSLASSVASMPPNEFDGAHKSSGGIGSTLAPQEAIFDIDDDEDWTAGAGIVRPLVTFVVVVAVSVAVMLV